MDQTEIQKPSSLDSLDLEASSTAETRKQLARHFEGYLIANMNAGKVEADRAQDTASTFVKIFESALTPESMHLALDTLSHDKNALLQGFFLKVEEMRLKKISAKLYDFMVHLVEKNEIAMARELFKMYESGQIKSTKHMEDLQLEYTLHAQVNKIQNALEAAKLTTQSQEIAEAFANNRIRSEADLAPWLAITAGIQQPVQTDSAAPIANTKTTEAASHTLAQRLVHLDQKLWKIVNQARGKN